MKFDMPPVGRLQTPGWTAAGCTGHNL